MTGPHPSAHPTRGRELVSLAAACGVIAVLVVVFARWLGVTNGAVVSLSFLVVVALAAAESTLRVAVGTSLAAAACFNYFFLPPVGTWTIADPGNWFALGAFVASYNYFTQFRQYPESIGEAFDSKNLLYYFYTGAANTDQPYVGRFDSI